jgi:putative tricarboxylic transport membrane protein
MSYAIEKKVSKHPEKFGTGIIEGVAAPETANNSYANAALIPLFTLGIPGSPTVAILMGALIMNGLTPGPLLFSQHATFVWAVIASLYIGNVILLILNLPLVNWWAKILKIPYNILVVVILVFCIIGAYSLNSSVFDIGMMIFCGLLGYVFKKLDFPLAPAILTLILGPLMEQSLRESLSVSQGDFSIFFTHPISLFFLILAGVIMATSAWQAWPSTIREESKEAEV